MIESKIHKLNSAIKDKIHEVKDIKQKDPSAEISHKIKEIWELSKEKFILESRANPQFKGYRGIIFTVGFSPEPIILNLLANASEYAYFISTKESEKYLDSIIDETGLKASQYKREVMKRDSASESYNLVKKGLKFLTEEKKLKKSEVALDPTGGTKIMSVGCGIAASIFNLDILYVNNEKYNPELRRPEPGTEVLINVPNPFDIYQDDELIEGFKYLETFNFSRAKDAFNYIKQISNKPLLPELLANIADILYCWDMIDYKGALQAIVKVRKLIERLGEKVRIIKDELLASIDSWNNYLIEIYSQIEHGVEEVEKISPLLIYDIVLNADREFHAANYNNAALKYYRAIEMINQYILLHDYNINTQNPNYEGVPHAIKESIKKKNESSDLEQLILKRYNAIWGEIYRKQNKSSEYKESNLLPRKIGLIAGVILRYILGDSSLNEDFIFKVLSAVDNRNLSIFAHGIVSISKKDCQKLKKIAEAMIQPLNIDREHLVKNLSHGQIKSLIEIFLRII